MLPRCRKRRQDGKEHLHKIVVENRCISAGRVLQRQQFGLDALWQRKLSLGRQGVCGLIFQIKAGRPPYIHSPASTRSHSCAYGTSR